jgi:hypothetical protein
LEILTYELLRQDTPLFEFVIRDAPYPMNNCYWPQPSEVDPFCFLAFGEFLMDELCHLFTINGQFDLYELTNFHTKPELIGLIINIEIEVAKLRSYDQEDFLKRFGFVLKILTSVDSEKLADQWDVLRSDLIEILYLICGQTEKALRDGKTVGIVGI